MNPKNDCKFIGRLTKDAETKTFDKGSVTSFTIAVSRNFKNKDGNYDADFIECRASNKIGETIAKYFKKGSPIVLAGDFRNNNWTDKDGNKHFSNYINVSDFAFPERDSNQNSTVSEAPTPAPIQDGLPKGLAGFDPVVQSADEYLPFS